MSAALMDGVGRLRGVWRRRRKRALLGLSLAILPWTMLLPHSLGAYRWGFIDRAEGYLYDMRVRAALTGGLDPRIVIVDIDENSLAVEGQWPWPRVRIACLLDLLFDEYRVRVVGFDVNFPEPQENSALRLIDMLAQKRLPPDLADWLQAQRASNEGDTRLAEAMVARDVVLGFVFKSTVEPGQPAEIGAIPGPIEVDGARLERVPWIDAQGYTGNLPVLQENATAAGFFDTPLVDEDGVVRRMPLIQRYRGGLYESLALAVARVATPGVRLEFGFRGSSAAVERLDFVALGDRVVRVDERGSVLTPFRGGVGSFPYVSAVDVLERRVPRDVLDDRIVLVGTSAPGLLDVRPTPVAKQYVGVEAHANMVAGLLDGNVKAVPPNVRAIDIVTLVSLFLLLGLVVANARPGSALLLVTAILVAIIAGNQWLFVRYGWVVPLAVPLIYVFLASFLLLAYGYFGEARRKRRLQGFFGQYVSPAIVRQLDTDDAELSLEGESRNMSVLFSDVRGFTTLSEGLTPRELTRMMNELLTPITEVIQAQRGTIDKYMGDAVMAFWGAPLADPEHARHAVLAALGLIDKAADLRETFASRGWPPIRIGVGVSTGTMNVGNMGSQFRMAYTVLGDTVNLGSRLEGLTKQYGVDVLVSDATRQAAADIVFREIDRVRVKGKLQPVAIHEPLGRRDLLSPDRVIAARRFEEALEAYRAQRFELAAGQLRELNEADGQELYAVYLRRIEHFLAHPPPADWDGVYVFETK